MGARDPFKILDVSPDTEWRVIQAAYDMLMGQMADVDNESEAIRDLKWAYEILKDPNRRLEYSMRGSAAVDGDDEASDGTQNGRHDRRSEVLSVLWSAVLFTGMLGGIVYGLYFVGAVPPNRASEAGMPVAVTAVDTRPVVKATDIPADGEVQSAAHTATVKALHATATRGALMDYTGGLTETMTVSRQALTPTPVVILACPNVASVNVRNGPGTGYSAIGYILEGDCVNVAGRDDGSNWIMVDNAPRPSSDGGWVSLELMTIDGDIEDVIAVDLE